MDKKDSLRKKAEELLKLKQGNNEFLNNENFEDLLQELRIYQIELESQNEELKNSQEELSIVSKYYKDLFNNSPSGYLTLDDDFEILEINNTLASILGSENRNIIGQYFTNYIAEKYQDEFYLQAKNILESKTDATFYLILKTSEKLVHVQSKMNYLESIEGRKLLRISIIDISSQVLAENQLKLSEEKFKELFNLSPNMIVIHGANNKIIDANTETFNKLGYTLQELRQLSMNEFFVDFPFEKLSQKNALEINSPIKIETTIRTKSGYLLPVQILAKMIDYDKGKALLANVIDISEHKKLNENLILEKEKAVEANQLKTAFLANTSHEIRTPLNAILGFSKLLKERIKDNPKALDFIEIVNSRAHQLLYIINDIIDLSKLEANQVSIVQEKFNLIDLLDEVYEVHRLSKKLAQKTKLSLKLEKQHEIINIVSDKIRIKQIIDNFLTNALKHTDLGYITIGYNLLENSKIEIYVQDTGKGIPKDKLDFICEPFAKLDNTEGTGLGLSIVKRISELIDAELLLSSEQGKGSKFSIIIDCSCDFKTNPQKINKTNMSNLSFLSNKKILIAEDDLFSQLLFSELFDVDSIDLEIVKDGHEVVQRIKNKSYDLIILDVDMPELNGLETSRQIRKLGINTPILIQTAYALNVDKNKSLEAGANDYINKPIESDVLYEKVEQLLLM
ncbi:MAG: PAS domain S-box protein [Bacteroidales bacterium]|nr:PAS domain S-box protein [Bacteroidales bacterium]